MEDLYTLEDFKRGAVVTPATISDWLFWIARPIQPVPHVISHKVVKLKAAPDEKWELVA